MKRIGKQLARIGASRHVRGIRARSGGRRTEDARAPERRMNLLGKVAVLHEGRIKPLDTVAREEVKQIYGRETIKVHDPADEIDKVIDPAGASKPGAERPVQSWGPVGAFLDWIIIPEHWDDQPFILVDYLPLQAPAHGRDELEAAQGHRPEVDHTGRRKAAPGKARV